ncbi:MAG TPA: dTDP-4-dehydrorhamnose 3,5-epimerase [Polyangia bacterium]|jgi:dTDP-4-dehydrorhamnose 3,5-epimerase
MKVVKHDLPGVYVLEPQVFGDARGFFLEFYNARKFAELGIDRRFVQDNHSRSARGVLRGLHYQLGHPQAKVVRVIVGEIFDVALDVRRGSPTFGQFTSHRLSAENKHQMFIPEGFAHGFYVLSDVAEITYKCSESYAPADERGIVWDDPALGIPWPLAGAAPLLSARDQAFGTLRTRPAADLPVYAP